MRPLPEPLQELLAWQEAADRERRLRNLDALIATGTRAPPPPAPRPEAGDHNEPQAPARASPGWRYITSPEALQEALEALAGAEFIAIDTETTGLAPRQATARLLQLAAPGTPAWVIDLPEIPEADRSGLAEILAGPIPKVLHNAKFDLAFLARAGLPVAGPIFDTMLAAQVLGAGLGEQDARLATLSRIYLERPLAKEMQASDWTAPTLTPEQLDYAAEDALVLVDLRPVLITRLKAARLVEAAKLEFACLPAIVEMEASGITIDLERWETMTAGLEEDLLAAEARAHALLQVEGLNLNSPPQLKKALQGLGLDLPDTKVETLAPLAEKHEVARALLDYRKASKMLSAFGRTYPKKIDPLTGRIHARYRQIGAATGRMSCSEPNLQQVPRTPEARACFITPPSSR